MSMRLFVWDLGFDVKEFIAKLNNFYIPSLFV